MTSDARAFCIAPVIGLAKYLLLRGNKAYVSRAVCDNRYELAEFFHIRAAAPW